MKNSIRKKIPTPGVLLNNVGVSTSTNPWEKTGNAQWVYGYIN